MVGIHGSDWLVYMDLIVAVFATAVAEVCDVESESCQISLQVQDYTKQHPIVWRSELYHKHLLLIIIVLHAEPRDVLINTAQLVMLVKDQLAHRLLTNIHRGGCGQFSATEINFKSKLSE